MFPTKVSPENNISIELTTTTTYNEFYVNSVDIHGNYSNPTDDHVGSYYLTEEPSLVSFSVLPDDISLDALLYPNPAKDQMSIYMSMEGAYRLDILSPIGQVLTSTLFTNLTHVDLRSFPAGLYYSIVTHEDSGQKVTLKFIRL